MSDLFYHASFPTLLKSEEAVFYWRKKNRLVPAPENMVLVYVVHMRL